MTSVIPTRSDQRHQPGFDRPAYRGRNRVGRCLGRLRRFRGIATRCDKRAVNSLAWARWPLS
jgi:transposase